MEKIIGDLDNLLWVLNFINQDIDKMKTGDFLKISSEMEEIFLRPCGINLWKDEKPEKKLKTNEGFIDNSETRGIVKDTQKIIKEVVEWLYTPKPKSEVLRYPVEYFVQRFDGDLLVFKRDLEGSTNKVLPAIVAELFYKCSSVSQENDFGFHRSLKNLKKCQAPECNNFFWQAHKKEKNYCSNKCAMRAYVKAKREVAKDEN